MVVVSQLVGVLLAAAAVWLLLPLFSECLSILVATTSRRSGPCSTELPRLLFLVPAHDEQLLIGGCVRSLARQQYPVERRRIVVVADNCGDATAEIARREGAECLERADLAAPGKPRALAWALAQLAADPWVACVVIDADSVVAPDYASRVAQRGPLDGKAVQTYFGTLNERESWLTRLAGVLTRCRYEVAYPLKARAGLNCPLTGNGMVLGRDLLRDGWDAFSLTENWELYARYTAAGVPIELGRDAKLYSQEASSLRQGQTQRKRWLAGRLGVARSYLGRIVLSGSVGWRQKLDAVVELAGLSPVLHLMGVVAVAGIGWLVGGSVAHWAAVGALLSLVPLVLQVVVVLWRHPEPGKTVLAFAMLPVYAVWRIVVVGRTLLGLKGMTWRRTARE